MRTRPAAALVLLLALGCLGAGTCTSRSQKTVMVRAPAKPFPCDLELFTTASEVTVPFEKLCVISAEGKSYYDDRSDASGRALARAREDACGCGADALIVQDSYRDRDDVIRVKFRDRMHATVYGVAIRYTGNRSAKSASSPVLEARLYTDDGRVFAANFQGTPDGRGRVWGTLPDGEEFRGEYFTVVNREETNSSYNTPWGPLRGVSESEVGPQVTHVTAVGNQGTGLRCITYPRGNHGFGSCRDSKQRDFVVHY